MKKLLKRVSVVLLVVCAVFACAFAVSACSKTTDYTFVIQYEDGSAVTTANTMTQICVGDPDNGGACYPLFAKNIYPDANGKLILTQQQVNEICSSETDVTVFAFHVLNVDGYKEDCAFEINGAKEYICKLSK
ncbi:MAG: hypothetical protein ACI4MB_03700 [Candidatus Coproplasma sp.]